MGIVFLSAAQIICVYGIFSKRKILTWDHVKQKKITAHYLYHTLKITKQQLKELQPDPSEWAESGLCTIADCDILSAVPVNPITHLQAPFDALFSFKSHELNAFGVRYEQLRNIGMTPETMLFFHYDLQEWALLGLNDQNFPYMSDDACKRMFGVVFEKALQNINP